MTGLIELAFPELDMIGPIVSLFSGIFGMFQPKVHNRPNNGLLVNL